MGQFGAIRRMPSGIARPPRESRLHQGTIGKAEDCVGSLPRAGASTARHRPPVRTSNRVTTPPRVSSAARATALPRWIAGISRPA